MIETTGSGDRRREAGSDAWSAAARSGTSAVARRLRAAAGPAGAAGGLWTNPVRLLRTA